MTDKLKNARLVRAENLPKDIQDKIGMKEGFVVQEIWKADKEDIFNDHIELCSKIHDSWDDLPKNIQEKLYDLVYEHFEP